MKKIFILAIIAVLGLSVTSCGNRKAQEAQEALKATLAQDPRPRYHDDEARVYGMPFMNWDIRFKVADRVLTVVEVISSGK